MAAHFVLEINKKVEKRQIAMFDLWPCPDLDLDLKNRVPPSKKFDFVPKYMCAEFGALGQQVTIIIISHLTIRGSLPSPRESHHYI